MTPCVSIVNFEQLNVSLVFEDTPSWIFDNILNTPLLKWRYGSKGQGKRARHFNAGIYLFKVSKGNTRAIHKIVSKLTIKTPTSLLLTFEQISYFTHCSSVSAVDFEQVNTGQVHKRRI